MNIIITGMMGVGKTTIGKKLARKLSLEFVDVDEYIERKTRRKIHKIFSENGESSFRQLEKAFCREVAQKRDCVISTGGKTLLNRDNLNVLSSSGLIITLVSAPQKILERIKKGGNLRPLLASHPENNFYTIYRQRKPLYLRLPNRIDTTLLDNEEVVEEILKLIKGEARRFLLNLDAKKSSVILKRGLVDDLVSYLKEIIQEKRVFILSDKNVFAYHGKKLLDKLKGAHIKPSVFLLQPGERQKSLKSAERIHRWLLQERATRSSLLVSFGGGVISDLGGFVSSTFHRGLSLVNVPTSLVSQVDASIGGKNGVNFKGTKNQIGTFYFPSFVLIDPLWLVTLNERQMKEGIIEALKAGIIGDTKLFQLIKDSTRSLLLKDMRLLEKVITGAIEVKMKIVQQDPFEKGKRRILNMGHTFGHALESYFHHRRLTHGEAVGLGLICASRMGTLMEISSEGVLPEIKETLKKIGAPVRLKNLDPAQILSLMIHDKKRQEDGLLFIIPQRIGKAVIRKNVEPSLIIHALKEISDG